ncbi:MAG: T9SS type A sorting domain-containing protein [Bacteroidia bacterium]
MTAFYIKRLALACLFSCMVTCQAQLVRYCVSIIPGSGNTDTVALGLQSLADTTVSIRALNLSMVFDTTCTDFVSYSTLVEDMQSWGIFFGNDSVTRNINVNYQGETYYARLLYANADPRPTNPRAVVLPAAEDQPLIIFKAVFQGNCLPEVYLEDQTENPLNQIGSVDNNAVPYRVDHFACAPVSIDRKLPSIKVWPNPSQGLLNLEYASRFSFSIYDAKGDLVQKGTSTGKKALRITEGSGLYVVRMQDESGRVFVRKVVVD